MANRVNRLRRTGSIGIGSSASRDSSTELHINQAGTAKQALSLLLLLLAATTTATAPARAAVPPEPLLVGQWGQNLARSQFWEAGRQEPPLADLCATRAFNVYHIDGVRAYSAVNGAPGLDLATHCSFPTDTFPGWPSTSRNGFSLIKCPAVGQDITVCQKLGKRVLLTIDPTDLLVTGNVNSSSYPANVAQNIWNIFLGGTSPTRPFGAAVLDGVDLHIWNNDATGVNLLATTLRSLMGDQYLLTLTVRCSFPDYIFNPSSWPNPEIFDYITVAFVQSPNVCGYRGNNPEGFWSTLSAWSAWTSSIQPLYRRAQNLSSSSASQVTATATATLATVNNATGTVSVFSGAPAVPYLQSRRPAAAAAALPLAVGLVAWPTEAWAQAATGDYVPASAFVAADLVPRLAAAAPNVAGVALQDASYDALGRPCVGADGSSDARTYSDVVWAQLAAPTPGAASPPSLFCSNASSDPGLPVSSSSSSSRAVGATLSAFQSAVSPTAGTADPGGSGAAPATAVVSAATYVAPRTASAGSARAVVGGDVVGCMVGAVVVAALLTLC